MANPELCLRNKFGYCKFNKNCQYRHNNKNCESGNCDGKDCDKRHPKECWWYDQFKRCKFTFCAYKHVKKEYSNDFNAKIFDLEWKIKEKDVEMKIQMEKIKELETKVQQNELESRVKHLEKFVVLLQEKLEKKEKDHSYLAQWNPEETGWTILDPLVRRKSFEHKCEECDYIGRNPSRLKLHIEVKHMHLCAICPEHANQLFKTKEELDTHTNIVHDNLEKPLTQEEFESLSENDFERLKYGYGFDNTPRKKDLDKKYSLRLRKQKEAEKLASSTLNFISIYL